MTYYFDNNYLLNYMKQDVELQVYVNREYLTIPDEEDLDDPKIGYGIRQSGQPVKFDYKAIDHVKVDDIIFDKKDLQASKEAETKSAEEEKPEDSPEGGTPPKGGEMETPPEAGIGGEEEGGADIGAPGEAPEEEEPKPKESYNIKVNDYVVDLRDGVGGNVRLIDKDVLVFEYYNVEKRSMATRPVPIKCVIRENLK